VKIENHLQTKLKKAADNLCLAITYVTLGLWKLADEQEKPAIETMTAAIIVNALDDDTMIGKDGFVKDGEKLLLAATQKKWRITKKRIDSLQDLPENCIAAVNYQYYDKNHWVGVINREVVYNSLEDSQCFKYGKPTDSRIMEIMQ
jgi:hypothetical protein